MPDGQKPEGHVYVCLPKEKLVVFPDVSPLNSSLSPVLGREDKGEGEP